MWKNFHTIRALSEVRFHAVTAISNNPQLILAIDRFSAFNLDHDQSFCKLILHTGVSARNL